MTATDGLDQPADDDRLHGLLADFRALYPGAQVRLAAPSDAGPDDAAAAERSFRVIPSARRPRAAVPTDAPDAVRAFLRRDTAGDRRSQRTARRAVALVAGSPLAGVAFRETIIVAPLGPDSIEAYLEQVTGGPVRLSLASGARRANAKPVLGVSTSAGEELGFCKVGLTPLAGALVRHESAVLRRLDGRLTDLVVPPVLHAGRWRDHDVLLMGAVRGTRGRGTELPLDAMREVAAVEGTMWCDLGSGPWATALRARSSAAPPDFARALHELLLRLVGPTRPGAAHRVLHGDSHGDWGPWNMAWNGQRAVVWDWERFASGVPVGMDAVHYVGHAALRRDGDLAGALAVLEQEAEPAVQAVLDGSSGTSHDASTSARLVVDAYLLEIACRFAVDAAAVSAPIVARVAKWYLRVAAARLGLDPARLISAPSTRSGTVPTAAATALEAAP